MHVDLRLLRQAQALVEHGSFSRAADALNVSQPALSRGIKELEDRVGLSLFNRGRPRVEPTDFGLVFMQHAADLLARAGDLEREVALAKGLQTGEVALGLGPYVAEVLAPVCAARFVASYPAVRLRITMDSPADLARMLRARTVDIVVADAGILGEGEDIEVLAKLAPLPAFLVTRAGHPLAHDAPVEFADAFAFPFAQVVMLPPRVLKPILALRQSKRKHGASAPPPFPAVECPTLRLAASIVAGSDAFTFATLGMVRPELEQRLIVPVIHEPWMYAQWSVVRLRKRTLSAAMTTLVDGIQRAHDAVERDEAVLRKRWWTGAVAGGRPPKRGTRAPPAQ